MHAELLVAVETDKETSAKVGKVDMAVARAWARKAVAAGMAHESSLAGLHGGTKAVVGKVAVVAWDMAVADSRESTSQVWCR